MSWTARMVAAISIMMVFYSPVFAETGARGDSSNALIWLFLSICGLIIFLQIVPVVRLAFRLAKGDFGKNESMEDELETATNKYS